MSSPNSCWISDPATLQARLPSAPARVGLDTEFIRERTFWPQLALVQIAVETADGIEVLLVDPLAPGIAEALRPMLGDPAILKIMHSASEDLVAFGHACGAVPAPLFDTQIAAAISGTGAGMGYQRLVQETLGVALSKGETRSDWLRRPLSATQLEYAVDDVAHLFDLHDTLAARLDALDRAAWLAEDCARLVATAGNMEGERWPQLGGRAGLYLDADAQRRLARLLRWREQYARSQDRPRSWILDNELATLLARDPPADMAALQQRLDAHPKAPRKLTTVIWNALTTPLPDEAEMPLSRGEEPDRKQLKRLQQAVAERSAALGLPDGVLASRKGLEAMLEGADWPGALSGWRRGQLEAALAPLLERTGEARNGSV
ncbi:MULTISPECIES: ribonuclease D [Luteimonas]|uniref:Ribonuclease D n=1 Tax=Luteimonas chenhongjianii TaxID=2006110 RepID=A0A290XIK8_9GAMM|nr:MULTISPECIES: ribonuclease D [Luteimonas]ATD68838.1 ribonuclease D [Luteimonas chenhongjianii]RPD88858.1 ribonuclease D [Luteimonas sp. 100069]